MAMVRRNDYVTIPFDLFNDSTMEYIGELKDGYKKQVLYFRMIFESQNTGGYLFRVVGDSAKPYTAESLSKKFHIDISTIENALNEFEESGIITIEKGYIFIPQSSMFAEGGRIAGLIGGGECYGK